MIWGESLFMLVSMKTRKTHNDVQVECLWYMRCSCVIDNITRIVIYICPFLFPTMQNYEILLPLKRRMRNMRHYYNVCRWDILIRILQYCKFHDGQVEVIGCDLHTETCIAIGTGWLPKCCFRYTTGFAPIYIYISFYLISLQWLSILVHLISLARKNDYLMRKSSICLLHVSSIAGLLGSSSRWCGHCCLDPWVWRLTPCRRSSFSSNAPEYSNLCQGGMDSSRYFWEHSIASSIYISDHVVAQGWRSTVGGIVVSDLMKPVVDEDTLFVSRWYGRISFSDQLQTNVCVGLDAFYLRKLHQGLPVQLSWSLFSIFPRCPSTSPNCPASRTFLCSG